MHQEVQHSKFFFSPGECAVCFCVPQNKQRIFHCTELTDWIFKTQMDCVYCAVRTETVHIIQSNPSVTVISVLWTFKRSLFKYNRFATQVRLGDYVHDMLTSRSRTGAFVVKRGI